MKKKGLEQLVKNCFLGSVLIGAGFVYGSSENYSNENNSTENDSKIYPSLLINEKQILKDVENNPIALQNWITSDVKGVYDENLFSDSLCEKNKPCDIWESATLLLRIRQGDCDDILAISHYSLNKSGVGLLLVKMEGNKLKLGHAVYVYKGDNQKYGIISIIGSEFRAPIFDSIKEAAKSFSEDYDYFYQINLPNDNQTLLYNLNVKDHIFLGYKINLNKKSK